MAGVEAMGAGALLAIPEGEPERLFGRDPSGIGAAFRALAKLWHPDRSRAPEAGAVFRHLVALHDAAVRKAAAGRWEVPGLLRLVGEDGRVRELSYRRRRDLDPGESYVGRTAVAFALPRADDDLADAADRALARAAALPEAMRDAYAPRMPRPIGRVRTADRTVHVFAKTPDQVPLADLVAHLGGRLDPVHAAWVTSEVESLACVLTAVGLCHAGLAPETLLASPRHHALGLCGGFAYAAPLGARLVGAPAAFAAAVPPSVLGGGDAREALTVEAARLVSAAAFGHRAPAAARHDPSIPAPVRAWLCSPNPGTCAADYAAWERARDGAFGPRRFVELRVDPDAVVPPR